MLQYDRRIGAANGPLKRNAASQHSSGWFELETQVLSPENGIAEPLAVYPIQDTIEVDPGQQTEIKVEVINRSNVAGPQPMHIGDHVQVGNVVLELVR